LETTTQTILSLIGRTTTSENNKSGRLTTLGVTKEAGEPQPLQKEAHNNIIIFMEVFYHEESINNRIGHRNGICVGSPRNGEEHTRG